MSICLFFCVFCGIITVIKLKEFVMENLKISLSVFGKYVICLLMCLFTVMSFSALFLMVSAPVIIGEDRTVYTVAENEEEREVIETYTYMYENGEDKDTKKTDYEAQGYKVETVRKITGPLSGVYKTLAHTLSQAVCLFFFIVIVPHELYKLGLSDRNKVQCGHMNKDLFRGMKLGGIVASINFISWICLVLAKFDVLKVGFAFYRFANYHLYGFQQLIIGDVTDYTTIPVWSLALAIVPTVLTLLVCWLTYLLGYQDINIYEKLVYKKK